MTDWPGSPGGPLERGPSHNARGEDITPRRPGGVPEGDSGIFAHQDLSSPARESRMREIRTPGSMRGEENSMNDMRIVSHNGETLEQR
ncbi:MAG: hypothetical protein JRG73_08770 [Deltaproteobacteria bacterium]|nr:hypothetical protein [Deltaproteobacteria bacterium]